MSNPFLIKCLKDTEGWWAEGEICRTSPAMKRVLAFYGRASA